MARIVPGAKPQNQSVYIPHTTETAYINTSEFFFYSNNPEKVNTSNYADAGFWFNRSSVHGNGQVYVWHENDTGASLNATLLVYNPSDRAIRVSVSNYGLTSGAYNDCAAWEQYFDGLSTSIVVGNAGYGNLFHRSIPSGHPYGVVARVSITYDGSTEPAGAVFFDLGYRDKSDGAQYAAPAESLKTLRMRGLGEGFYVSAQFEPVSPTDSNGTGYKFAGGQGDSFNDLDCSYITDPSGETTGRLDGAFGQQFSFTLPVRNDTSYSQRFRIFFGSNGGPSFPFVNFQGQTSYYDGFPECIHHMYVDLLETEELSPGETESVNFFTVVTAGGNSPFVVGARTL